jgi:hypothetical protein
LIGSPVLDDTSCSDFARLTEGSIPDEAEQTDIGRARRDCLPAVATKKGTRHADIPWIDCCGGGEVALTRNIARGLALILTGPPAKRALMQSIRVETAAECQRASGSQFITVTLRGPDGVTVLELTIQAANELAELLSRHLR